MPLLNCMAQSDLHSGTCGWGLTWTYSEETKTLTISGAGDMSDYDRKNKTAPWYNFRRDIQNIIIGPEVYSIGECAFVDVSTDSIAIPNSVARIGKWAFFSSELKSLTIPLGITTLEESTFNGCRSLSKINLPNTLTSIGDKAFYKCRSIISIDIPNKVTSIGEFAFWECTSLTSVTIPNSVTNIGYNAFDGDVDNTPIIQTIISLIENPFEIGGRALYEDNEYRGVFSRKTFENAKLYVPNGTIDRYKATNGWKDFNNIVEAGGSEPGPNSGGEVGDVFEIDGLKYEICENNTVVVVSNDNKYSGDIVIPDQVNINGVSYSVTTIGEMAFSGCSLTSITMPNSVTTIGNFAFRFCPFTSVTIPQSVRSIGDYVFSDCSSLVYIIVSDGNTTYDSRDNCNAIIETASNTLVAGCSNTTIPNNVTSIGTGAFSGCRGFTSITIPNSVTSIGDCAFLSCRTLTTITIPNSVTSIGQSAFEDCNRITYLSIGNSVASIGWHAFDDCRSLLDVYCYAVKVPETDVDAFRYQSNDISNATLHVPASSIEVYKASLPWSNFKEIVALDGSGVQALEADNSVIQINSIRGERLEAPSKGINIIKMKDGTTKKVLIK